jgi:hypothetical protein
MSTAAARPAPPGASTGRGTPPGSAGDHAPRRWLRLLPAWAGICYLAAWVAGLAAWPVNLPLNATNAQVAASYRAHQAGAVSQYLLSEAVAGLLLGIVLAAALFGNRDRSRARPWPAAAAAAGAVVISLVQAVVGMFLIAAAAHYHVARAGGLSDLVTRLDGVKMLALAAVAAYLAGRRSWDRRPPGWLRAVAALTAAALVASGLAYLLLANPLAWMVYISGPLLLLWIASTGVWLTRSSPAQGTGTPA